MAPLQLLLLLYFVVDTQSQSLCADEEIYCISGLDVTNQVSQICALYRYQGIFSNCSFFGSIDGLSLYFNSDFNTWDIRDQFSNLYAYCQEDILDDCIKNTWTIFPFNQGLSPTLEITPCTYNNSECLDTYTPNDTYCIANTDHRTINQDLTGEYEISFCYLEQPVFVNDNLNVALQWDDMLSTWHISFALSSAGQVSRAYCTQTDITQCTQNWYIWNGSMYEKDELVVSGFCGEFNYSVAPTSSPSYEPTYEPTVEPTSLPSTYPSSSSPTITPLKQYASTSMDGVDPSQSTMDSVSVGPRSSTTQNIVIIAAIITCCIIFCCIMALFVGYCIFRQESQIIKKQTETTINGRDELEMNNIDSGAELESVLSK